MPRVRIVLRMAAAVAWLVPCAAAAASLSGGAAVTVLNAQREASGLPGDLVVRNDWTAACAAHTRAAVRTIHR